MREIEFKKTDARVAGIIKNSFPGYKGRRPVRVAPRETYSVHDYWDGGSRDYTQFVHLDSLRSVQLDSLQFEKQTMGNPYNAKMGKLTMTPAVAVVVNAIFRGKDMGIRIYVHPEVYNEWEKDR